MEKINLTPYIIFALGLCVTFITWLVKENFDLKKQMMEMKESLKKHTDEKFGSISEKFQEEIDHLKQKQASMESDVRQHSEKHQEVKTQNEFIERKLNEVSQALAVARNGLDMLMLKFLKTKTAQ